MTFLSRARTMVVIGVVAILLISMALVISNASKLRITAYFDQAKGIYVGDDVTVLGVPVGKVVEITPGREHVVVTMEIDGDQQIPVNAKAALVSKSLVSVRSIVLGPAFDGGEAMEDGDEIPISRTTVPVEFDDVKNELVRLTEALGPHGANQAGVASELVTSTAGFLDGNGADIRATIDNLSTAAQTLADNDGNLFGTVRNLEVFVTALEGSDQVVRDFETQLAGASEVLAQNRASIVPAIEQFQTLASQTKQFFDDNGVLLQQTLESLQTTTSVVAENRQSVADLLQVAPTALSNLHNLLDPRVPAVTGELAITNLGDPAYIICGGLFALGGSTTDCRNAIAPIAELLKLGAPPIGLNPITSSKVGPGLTATPENAEQQGQTPGAGPAAAPVAPAAPADTDLLGQISQLLEENR